MAPQFWLWALVLVGGFFVVYWRVVQGALESEKNRVMAKQRAIAQSLGPRILPFRDKLEGWVQELAKPWPGPTVLHTVSVTDLAKSPGVYLRIRMKNAGKPESIREAAARSSHETFVLGRGQRSCVTGGASIVELRAALRAAGARPLHETLMLRAWVRGLALDGLARSEDVQLPLKLRGQLPDLEARFGKLVSVLSEHRGADASTRFLLALCDGRTIESVLLPGDGVCVSTQVGCAVGCVFCMTGRDGLVRHLTSGEIAAQVALARTRQKVRRVVFMGMGEPAHNLDAVLETIDLLGTEGDLATKNLVFSTVGDRRVFERLPRERIKPALALSLHTTKPELRAQLLPRAPRIEPAELVALADAYSRATKYPTQYQWTLLEGINDGDDELDALASLLDGHYAVVNFIPYNTVDGADFRRPSWERAAEMARYLHRRGVLAKLRRSAGQDVEAGCGQLRARHGRETDRRRTG